MFVLAVLISVVPLNIAGPRNYPIVWTSIPTQRLCSNVLSHLDRLVNTEQLYDLCMGLSSHCDGYSGCSMSGCRGDDPRSTGDDDNNHLLLLLVAVSGSVAWGSAGASMTWWLAGSERECE